MNINPCELPNLILFYYDISKNICFNFGSVLSRFVFMFHQYFDIFAII